MAATTLVATAPVVAPIVPRPVVAAAAKPKGAKVGREQRNGVKKSSPGKCLDVWNAMQALYEKTGNVPTSKDATDWATANSANLSNATQELSRWRKFAGFTKPAKAAKEVQARVA